MVILLKSLEDHLFKASISEDMLEILEVLEKHLLDGSNSITTTMKSAYCRVAVECTLKYLEAKASHPTYLQAVDRIWRGRILAIASHVSHLFSDDLKNWKTEIENSLLVINKFVSLPDIFEWKHFTRYKCFLMKLGITSVLLFFIQRLRLSPTPNNAGEVVFFLLLVSFFFFFFFFLLLSFLTL
jgi:hypothetical protein